MGRPIRMLVAMLLCAATAAGSEIVDNAGCFSDEAVKKAEARLSELEAKSGIPTLIETFATASRQEFPNAAERDRFFQAWLRDVAKKRDAQGVAILLCLKPGRVQVDFHKNLYASGHRQSEHAAIRDAALPALRQKDYDAALSAMVEATGRALTSSHPAAAPVPASPRARQPAPTVPRPAQTSNPMLMWGVIGIIAVVVIVGVVWAMSYSGPSLPESSNRTQLRNRDLWPAVKCPNCGAETRREVCESCGGAVPREPLPQPVQQAPMQPQPAQMQQPGVGGFDLLTGMLLGQAMSGSHHRHHDDHPHQDPPVSSDGGFGGSGFGGGGFDGGGGGDFSGGSGGDF